MKVKGKCKPKWMQKENVSTKKKDRKYKPITSQRLVTMCLRPVGKNVRPVQTA